MVHPLTLLCGVVFVVLSAVLVVAVVQPRIEVVPEGQEVVVYRRGRFQRVAGPGWVPYYRFENIARTVNTRDEPKSFIVDNLFIFGIPVGFTLYMWSRVDLRTAAGANWDQLRRLGMFSDSERHQQIVVKAQEAFKRRLAALEQQKVANGDAPANIVEKIIPILPGTPDCEALLTQVQGDLTESLPSVGVFVDQDHSLMITQVNPPAEMIAGFSRDRVVQLLRISLPQLPGDKLANMAAAIEGLKGMETRVYDIRSPEAAPPLATYRIKGAALEPTFLGPAVQPGLLPPPAPEPLRAVPLADSPAEQEEEISAADLKVLKRVPPYQG